VERTRAEVELSGRASPIRWANSRCPLADRLDDLKRRALQAAGYPRAVAFRFRLLDVEGNDLGPLVSQEAHWSVGQRVHRGSGDEWVVTAVVPSEDAMDCVAYLVVEAAPPSAAT
jgi:hypothetical protein